jgi:ribonuclease D
MRARLDEMLVREGRMEMAEACFQFLATRARLDLIGYGDQDIFSH